MTDKRKEPQEKLDQEAQREANEYTVVCLIVMGLIMLMAVASAFTAG